MSANVYHLSHFLRDYRNYIHPGNSARKAIDLDPQNINLIKDTVDLIIKEITKEREINFGLTATQIAKSILENEDFIYIFQHSFEKVKNNDEKKKFIVEMVPEMLIKNEKELSRFYNNEGIPEPNDYGEQEQIFFLESQRDRIINCYFQAIIKCDESLREENAERSLEIISSGSWINSRVYVDIIDIEIINRKLKQEDKKMIKDYIMSKLWKIRKKSLFKYIELLPEFIEGTECDKIFKELCEYVKRNPDTDNALSMNKFIISTKNVFGKDKYSEYLKIIEDTIYSADKQTGPKLEKFFNIILGNLSEKLVYYIPF